MQTLEINFKAIFENLPGKNILLMPDPPFFTVVGISNAYCKAASLERKDALGKPIAEVFREATGKYGAFSVKDLFDSLEHAFINKARHSIVFTASAVKGFNSGAVKKLVKVTNIPVCSPGGDVLYIIQNIGTRSQHIRSGAQGQGDHDAKINLQSIIRQAPVAMGILRGKNMVVETANAHLLDLWGKDETIIGLPVLQALPEIIDQAFPDLLNKVFDSGEEYHGFETEAILQRKGVFEKLYFNFIYAPLKNTRGDVTGIMLVASDVTNLVKAKKALEDSEKRYRDLIALAPVATAIYIGEHMEVRLANQAMLKLWGKDPSVIGKPLATAIPEIVGQPFLKLLQNVYKTGQTYHSTEDRADLVVDGQLQSFYFNFTYKPLRNAEGEVYGILNMAVDVSDTVKAKIKINDSEERLRIALNSAELGTWDYYPLSDELICSARTRELFGLSEKAPVSFKKLFDAVNRRDRRKVKEVIVRALKYPTIGGFRIEYEVDGIEDHKERWQRATGTTFFNNNGVAYRLTGTVLDITERKRIEEALEERVQLRTIELLDANKELERSNRELEQYAYVASHDLQEPLRKILVYTDLLKNGRTHTLIDRIKLDKIMSSAHRMSLLIKDLLNFSRLIKTESIFSVVDLNIILKNVIDDFELKIQETGARITMELLPVIEASPQQMNQLFYNLINNALKFTKEGEPPVISIGAKPVSEEELDKHEDLNRALTYIDIQVADKGIGFNPKYMGQIFEIFKRLHPHAKFEGTGIGLALCRKIALNHHGDIYAESTEGSGSVFHVLLPVSQTPL